MQTLEIETITVRTMREDDLPALVRIDAAHSGRRRENYLRLMLRRAVELTPLQVSLVAELEERVVGFLIGSIYYGEFGIVEPTGSLEGIAVDPAAARQGVATALLRQFRTNARALGVTSIRTTVEWNDYDLLAFLESEGFSPAKRVCLEA